MHLESTCKTFVTPFVMGLQFVVIHLAIVSLNLSEVDFLRPRCSVRVVCRKLGDMLAEVLAESLTNVCFTLMWYFKQEVLR